MRLALLVLAVPMLQPTLDWPAVKAWVRESFPGAAQITTAELAERLAAGERPLLLDVRTAEEFAVSHLPGAVRVDPDAGAEELRSLLVPGRPVVAYCSVGYRSSALVERLARAGVADAVNLEGSIFEWANEGRPVVRDGRPVAEVHPYDARWGRLLREELRAPRP